jgi:hypothetical protein
LVQLVEQIRHAKGPKDWIPQVDPRDGGTDAEVLILLEAPRSKTVACVFD